MQILNFALVKFDTQLPTVTKHPNSQTDGFEPIMPLTPIVLGTSPYAALRCACQQCPMTIESASTKLS